jgi:DNA-binding MarR family transcriptional regulator
MTPAPVQIEDSTAIQLWGATIKGFHATNRRLHAAIKAAFNLNEAETETLLTLHRSAEQRAPMATLARAAAYTSGGFTKIADKLTQRGLVARVAGSDDRRVIFVELTQEGKELAGELNCLVAEINRAQFIEVLGLERAQLVADAMRDLYRANTPPKA